MFDRGVKHAIQANVHSKFSLSRADVAQVLPEVVVDARQPAVGGGNHTLFVCGNDVDAKARVTELVRSFGWKDVTVVKIGASYDVSKDLTLRAGYSHSEQPIPNSQTLFNILAPGTVQHHLSLGATWKTQSGGELSAFYTRGFQKTVNGSGSIPANFGGGNANVRLEENVLGVAYGWKL